jgi:hypothetical protein
MTERIIQKIEHIRSLPEHMRLRYAFGAVAICMIFVIGIWMLTLKQGFLQMSPEVSQGKDQAEETLSHIPESLPATDSLKSLKENSESLKVDANKGNAEEFLNQELERKNTNPTNPEVQ